MKLTGRKDTGYSKYTNMVDNTMKIEPEKSHLDMLKTAVFGEDQSTLNFQ